MGPTITSLRASGLHISYMSVVWSLIHQQGGQITTVVETNVQVLQLVTWTNLKRQIKRSCSLQPITICQRHPFTPEKIIIITHCKVSGPPWTRALITKTMPDISYSLEGPLSGRFQKPVAKVTTPKCDTCFWLVNCGGWWVVELFLFIDSVIRKCKGKRMQLVQEFLETIWITYKFFKLTS